MCPNIVDWSALPHQDPCPLSPGPVTLHGCAVHRTAPVTLHGCAMHRTTPVTLHGCAAHRTTPVLVPCSLFPVPCSLSPAVPPSEPRRVPILAHVRRRGPTARQSDHHL